jgi:hypothetical protein
LKDDDCKGKVGGGSRDEKDEEDAISVSSEPRKEEGEVGGDESDSNAPTPKARSRSESRERKSASPTPSVSRSRPESAQSQGNGEAKAEEPALLTHTPPTQPHPTLIDG